MPARTGGFPTRLTRGKRRRRGRHDHRKTHGGNLIKRSAPRGGTVAALSYVVAALLI